MKTERRHDLENNELAVRMTGWIENFKPHIGSLVGGLVILIGIAVASSYWASQSAATRQAAWDEFVVAQDTADIELMSLRRVADKDEYSGTPMREWAYITWADRQMLLASDDYLRNRKSAQDRLRQVLGIYEELAAGISNPEVQNRARFGMARVYELQNKLEKAREQYSLVQGDLQPLASQRAEYLDSPEVQEMCDWLASAELPQPSVGEGTGIRPNFDALLPDATQDSQPQGDKSTNTRSLEDILGAIDKDAGGEERYTEDSAEAKEADEETESTTDEEVATDAEEQ